MYLRHRLYYFELKNQKCHNVMYVKNCGFNYEIRVYYIIKVRDYMEWNKEIMAKIEFENIKNIEEKKQVAKIIENKVQDGQVIGFGSGSTSYLAIIGISVFLAPSTSFCGSVG